MDTAGVGLVDQLQVSHVDHDQDVLLVLAVELATLIVDGPRGLVVIAAGHDLAGAVVDTAVIAPEVLHQHSEDGEVGLVDGQLGLNAPLEVGSGTHSLQVVGVVTLSSQLQVNALRIVLEGGHGSIPQQSRGVLGNGSGIDQIAEDQPVVLGLSGVVTHGNGSILSRGTELGYGDTGGSIGNAGVNGDTNVELAVLVHAVQLGADGVDTANGDTVDLHIVLGAVVSDLEGVGLAAVIVHGSGDGGGALDGEGAGGLLGGQVGDEALDLSGTRACAADQAQPVLTEVNATGSHVLSVGEVEGQPVVSFAVLAAVGIVIHAELEVDTVLQRLSLLGLHSEEGGVVGEVGGDGHETLGGVLITGSGNNDLALLLGLVGGRITENVPVTLNSGGSRNSHHGNHGDDHDHGDDKRNQLFHSEKTPFKIFHAGTHGFSGTIIAHSRQDCNGFFTKKPDNL